MDHLPIADVLEHLPPPPALPSSVPPRDPSAPPPPAKIATRAHPLIWVTLAFAVLGVVLGATAIALAVTR